MTATRRTASITLALAGALLLVIGGLLLYARVSLFNSDAFADRATDALAEQRVREALTEPIVNAIVDSGPAELINAQPILEAGVGGVIDTSTFRRTFRGAARDAHSALFEGDVDALVLNLADAGVIAISAVRSISPDVAERIPEDLEPQLIEITDSGLTLDVAPLAHDVRVLGIVLPLLGLALLAGSVALAPTPRTGVIWASAAVAVASGVAIAAFLIGRSLVLAQFEDEVVHDAAAAGWDAFLGDLFLWFAALGVGGVIIAAAAYAGVREVDPAAPLRRLAAIASWRPARASIRLARAVGILGVSLLLVLRPEAGLHVAVVAIGGWGLFVAATEILLVIAPPPDPSTEGAGERAAGFRSRLRPGRVFAVLGALAAVAVGVVVVSAGSDEEVAAARPPGPVPACNGFEELCERTVDQVSFAATHNSMSAAREEDWYLPNNRHGIGRQLEDGIRALLIDTHYGIETSGGNVVTDLERETPTRAEIEEKIGADGIERVDAIRDRLGEGDPADAEPYLCHVFCELGATELTEALTEIREFLDTHPDEFVILFVEDVVVPEDAADAFEASGILRYAYEHQRGEPFPTLRELIEADERVMVLGEMHSGGSEFPWYEDGFTLVQETPFTFHSPEEIASPAGCRPNRGTEHSPMFQINNWVEQIPRSPDLAGEVNDFDALLGRARMCERRRGLLPNLIAVDHYDRGEVLEVVNVLNGLDRDAEPEVRTVD